MKELNKTMVDECGLLQKEEQEIVYSSSNLHKIRKKDPDLQAMVDQWEQMFECEVQITPTEQGGIRVKPLDIKYSHRIS